MGRKKKKKAQTNQKKKGKDSPAIIRGRHDQSWARVVLRQIETGKTREIPTIKNHRSPLPSTKMN